MMCYLCDSLCTSHCRLGGAYQCSPSNNFPLSLSHGATETETETETPQFQINTKGGVGAANAKPCKGGETDSSHCSGKTIEATQNGPDLGV